MARIVACIDSGGNRHEVSVDKLAWRPSAYTIVIKHGRLLLASERGKYTLPGGGIELGETPEEAVIREVKEETGVNVRRPELLACRSEFFTHHGEKNTVFHHQTILLFYRCEFVDGKLSIDFLPEQDRPFHGMPEWIELDKLEGLEILSRTDWRPMVREVANRENYRH